MCKLSIYDFLPTTHNTKDSHKHKPVNHQYWNIRLDTIVWTIYTSRFLLTGHVGLILLSAAETAATRPLTAKLRSCPFSSVPYVSDRLELHNNNWASGSQHLGPSESDVYSGVIQEAQSNDLLHTVRLSVHLDTPLHGNNARGAKYAVKYTSVVTHTVFENIKMAALTLCWNKKGSVASLASLFPPASRSTVEGSMRAHWRYCDRKYYACRSCRVLS